VIRDVKYQLTLKFSDNSVCVVDSDAVEDRFQDVKRGPDMYGADTVFYPGQKLRGPMKCLKNADFSFISDDLKRAKDRKFVSVVVDVVKPLSLNVHWQWLTPKSDEQDEAVPKLTKDSMAKDSQSPPSELVKGDDLEKIRCLNLHESCTVQIGDISYYTPTSKDNIIDRNDWRKLKAVTLSRSTQSKDTLVSKNQGSSVEEKKTTTVAAAEKVKEKDDNDDEYETLETIVASKSNNKLASLEPVKNSVSFNLKLSNHNNSEDVRRTS
jgi:hypothetical protein